jgi:hypothetical protein
MAGLLPVTQITPPIPPRPDRTERETTGCPCQASLSLEIGRLDT